MYKGQPNQAFLAECIRALALCPNLVRFRLTPPAVLPSFLPTLASPTSKTEKLAELCVNGTLTMAQSEFLVSGVKGLRVLRVEHGSWCLMHLIPRWVKASSLTLTSLAFVVSGSSWVLC